MQFKDLTIKEAVESVNKDYYIPVFQRQLTWETKDIRDLFDSILKDYYIGSLLFWSIEPQKSEGKLCYEFIEDYITEEIYPPTLDGNRKSDLYKIQEPQRNKTMIIDGQQRLNSLYIGLCGSIFSRKSGANKKVEDSWSRKTLYINLNSNPMREEDVNKFEFEFRKSGGCHGKKYWYEVSNILQVEDIIDEIEKVKEKAKQDGLDEFDSLIVESTIDTLYTKIHSDKVLAYYKLEEQKQSEMHRIFIRINESGSQLTKEDELMSRMTPVWHKKSGQLPREEFNKFCEEVNERYNSVMGGYTLTPKDIVAFLYDTQEFGTRLKSFNKEQHKVSLNEWNKEHIQKSFIELCAIMKENSISLNSINKVDKRVLIYCLYHRRLKKKEITQEFKDDLINLLVLIRFNPQINSTSISSAIRKIDNIEDIPFHKIDSNIPNGLKFDVEAVVENLVTKTITPQLVFMKLLDKEVASDSTYFYCYPNH